MMITTGAELKKIGDDTRNDKTLICQMAAIIFARIYDPGSMKHGTNFDKMTTAISMAKGIIEIVEKEQE